MAITKSDEKRLKLLAKGLHENITHFNDQLNVVFDVVNKPLSDSNFEKAAQIFYDLASHVPLMKQILPAGLRIVRTRLNEENELFRFKHQISYRRNSEGLSAGRFNLPNQAMFYGALPVDNPNTNQMIAATLECCKELIDEDNVKAVRDFTIGAWYTIKPLNLLNLCFDRQHLVGNQELRKSVDEYVNILRRNCSQEVTTLILSVTGTLSQISKERDPIDMTRIYFLLNAFRIAVDKYYDEIMKSPVDGIIYPSAMTESKSLNIVLKPSVVDDSLKLSKVVMQRFTLVGKEYFSVPCSELLNVSGDEFEFKRYVPTMF